LRFSDARCDEAFEAEIESLSAVPAVPRVLMRDDEGGKRLRNKRRTRVMRRRIVVSRLKKLRRWALI
jgi:hypothetical protein